MSAYAGCAEELLKVAASAAQMHRRIAGMAPRGVHVLTDPTKDTVKRNWGGGVFGPHHLLEEALGPGHKLPKGKIVMTSKDKDPTTLAHEMGHAQFDEGTIGKVMQNPYVRGSAPALGLGAGMMLGSAAGMSAGALAGAAVGGALGAAGHVPTLVGEGMASMKAVDNLRAAGASEQQVAHAKRQMGRWFLTYMKDPLKATVVGAGAGALGGLA